MFFLLEGNQDQHLNGFYEISSACGDNEHDEIFLCNNENGKVISVAFEPGMIPEQAYQRSQVMVVGNTAYFE